ncbi:post-GPI attachment to proteins factor 3-like [Actinia tenebrosa]|uniref:Post-GPI attachment to proteins factor 3 n=1 Tax=Actinia tenebrosa TaxID=6105 RepID=A0A6P8INQ5_ACTTE|nr:post-GPI attachment to proteins factor 3-like [Actinia tenebrosa]
MRFICGGLEFALAILCCISPVSSSAGDRSYRFLNCVSDCEWISCNIEGYPRDLPWYLRLFSWDCLDECKYNCMHKVTADDVANNRSIKQFYGKWPFVRCLGIQEPASTLFSILNGVAHVAGWQKYVRAVPQDYQMYNVWKTYMLVNVNAWTWSTIFHTRDLNWTEKLDYFCATSLILFSIFTFFVRVVGPDNKLKCGTFASVLLLIYSCHVYYLGFVKFDYSYNMKMNVIIGVINILGWLIWSLRNYHKQRYVWKAAALTSSVFFLIGLEVFDFPPIWWTFDAHSLWHFGTIPLCYFWYSFLIEDAKYQLREEIREKNE